MFKLFALKVAAAIFGVFIFAFFLSSLAVLNREPLGSLWKKLLILEGNLFEGGIGEEKLKKSPF